ncbi:hypothetical protein FOA52_001163 [Chlamydomonas sp. UWO 241]|nr:hypothetical protein FOA52_001163 [Chlamydomonas sp. UWO 241]
MGCASSAPSVRVDGGDAALKYSVEGDARHGGVTQYAGKNNQCSHDWESPDFGVSDHFEVVAPLGEGASGETWLCVELTTGREVAIKFIRRPLPKIIVQLLIHEVKIQAALGHRHVSLIACESLLLTDSHLGIVMEYASGGTLTDYVTSKWETCGQRDGLFCTEDEARYLFRQYIDAVEFLHANNTAHRDLKLDNLVLDGSSPPQIKLCDFGFARGWADDDDAVMYTQIGTPVYMSPQLIRARSTQGGYDATKADIWACAVVLFVQLHGMFPYDHPDHPNPNTSDAHAQVWCQQMACAWRDVPGMHERLSTLSPECQQLLDRMFDRDEGARPTIAEIKRHAWTSKRLPPHLQHALNGIRRAQRALKASCGAESTNGPIARSAAKLRDAQIDELVRAAAALGPCAGREPGECRMLNLRVGTAELAAAAAAARAAAEAAETAAAVAAAAQAAAQAAAPAVAVPQPTAAVAAVSGARRSGARHSSHGQKRDDDVFADGATGAAWLKQQQQQQRGDAQGRPAPPRSSSTGQRQRSSAGQLAPPPEHHALLAAAPLTALSSAFTTHTIAPATHTSVFATHTTMFATHTGAWPASGSTTQSDLRFGSTGSFGTLGGEGSGRHSVTGTLNGDGSCRRSVIGGRGSMGLCSGDITELPSECHGAAERGSSGTPPPTMGVRCGGGGGRFGCSGSDTLLGASLSDIAWPAAAMAASDVHGTGAAVAAGVHQPGGDTGLQHSGAEQRHTDHSSSGRQHSGNGHFSSSRGSSSSQLCKAISSEAPCLGGAGGVLGALVIPGDEGDESGGAVGPIDPSTIDCGGLGRSMHHGVSKSGSKSVSKSGSKSGSKCGSSGGGGVSGAQLPHMERVESSCDVLQVDRST